MQPTGSNVHSLEHFAFFIDIRGEENDYDSYGSFVEYGDHAYIVPAICMQRY
uniref:Uncharacterized protein n=1 Tax=Arundo donax TaxID=35708 RepID=A0A0A9BCP7_ARUDO